MVKLQCLHYIIRRNAKQYIAMATVTELLFLIRLLYSSVTAFPTSYPVHRMRRGRLIACFSLDSVQILLLNTLTENIDVVCALM